MNSKKLLGSGLRFELGFFPLIFIAKNKRLALGLWLGSWSGLRLGSELGRVRIRSGVGVCVAGS